MHGVPFDYVLAYMRLFHTLLAPTEFGIPQYIKNKFLSFLNIFGKHTFYQVESHDVIHNNCRFVVASEVKKKTTTLFP